MGPSKARDPKRRLSLLPLDTNPSSSSSQSQSQSQSLSPCQDSKHETKSFTLVTPLGNSSRMTTHDAATNIFVISRPIMSTPILENKRSRERRHILKEFPELLSCNEYSKVLEVGCANGSTVLPILCGFPKWLACNPCSEVFLQKQDIFLSDVVVDIEPINVTENTGLYDMTMLRFEPDKKLGSREYMQSDGTSYFFCLDTVRDLFAHAGFNEEVHKDLNKIHL